MVDPFRVVRVVSRCLDKVRRRVQDETAGHRGRKSDPLSRIRKILLSGRERVTGDGIDRMLQGLHVGDPTGEVQHAWATREDVHDIYLAATAALDHATAWCPAPASGSDVRTLAQTLVRWHDENLAHHTSGASNSCVEAANLTVKQAKRSRRAFTKLNHHRLHIMLSSDGPREHHLVARHRDRPNIDQ